MTLLRPALIGILCAQCLLVLPAGCQPAEQGSDPAAADRTPAAPQPAATAGPQPVPQQRAAAARDALFERLSTELLATMSSRGPAAAIEVCSKRAPQLAAEVGQLHGVRIGRTGVRLRNSRNTPPTWAAPLLQDQPREPQFVELSDHSTGALFPILLKIQCETCHGPVEQIAAEIRSELQRLYPDDQATGFKDGDLRGWFWVEVPAAGPAADAAAVPSDQAAGLQLK